MTTPQPRRRWTTRVRDWFDNTLPPTPVVPRLTDYPIARTPIARR